MDKNLFHKQADLLISVLPHIAKDSDFALHGGTAINFFVRNMPRISVDIDLTYLPVNSRGEALKEISQKLKTLSARIYEALPSVRIDEKTETPANLITKIFIKRQNAVIKVEPNQVIRGALFACTERDLCKRAEDMFEKFVTTKTLSFAEIYGSKICAALDRQHPRDIFDIMLLLKNEGITNDVRKAFLVYLISHNRPISELLMPNLKDMKPVFEKEFSGMALIEVRYKELEDARRTLIKEINKKITDDERTFLMSFKEEFPRWELLGVKGVQDMPAIKWKLANLMKMGGKKRKEAIDRLRKMLWPGGRGI